MRDAPIHGPTACSHPSGFIENKESDIPGSVEVSCPVCNYGFYKRI